VGQAGAEGASVRPILFRCEIFFGDTSKYVGQQVRGLAHRDIQLIRRRAEPGALEEDVKGLIAIEQRVSVKRIV